MKTLRPLQDRLVVKRIEYQHPILAVVGVVLHKGVVVAAGPGRRRKKMTRFDGMPGRPPSWFEDGGETGKFTPMDVKVGDVVEFSPRQQTEFEFEGEQYVMVWRKSCYGIDPTASQSSAMLWQQSAGFDRKGNFMSGAEAWQRA
jgi:co-chaperonin GroES (HSP10)